MTCDVATVAPWVQGVQHISHQSSSLNSQVKQSGIAFNLCLALRVGWGLMGGVEVKGAWLRRKHRPKWSHSFLVTPLQVDCGV